MKIPKHYVVIGCIVIGLFVLAQLGGNIAWANINTLQTVPTPTPTSVGGEDNTVPTPTPASVGDEGNAGDEQGGQAEEVAGGSVVGTLIDQETRANLANVTIQLGQREIQTDKSGIFRLTNISLGEHKLVVLSEEGAILAEQQLEVNETGVSDLVIEVNPNQVIQPTPETVEDEANAAAKADTVSLSTETEQSQSNNSMTAVVVIGVIIVLMVGAVAVFRRQNA